MKDKEFIKKKIKDAYVLGYEVARGKPDNHPRIYAEDKIKEIVDEIIDNLNKNQ